MWGKIEIQRNRYISLTTIIIVHLNIFRDIYIYQNADFLWGYIFHSFDLTDQRTRRENCLNDWLIKSIAKLFVNRKVLKIGTVKMMFEDNI